jgi:hypothetical protein
MRARALCCVAQLLVLLGSTLLLAQQPQSDSQAVAFAAQSIVALTNGIAITDVTLSGSVTWTGGSNTKTGNATAYGKTNLDSRLDLTLPDGNRSEIRNSITGAPQGAWVDANRNSTPSATQNCWTDAVWFFPALTSLSAVNSDPTLVLVYVAAETHNGSSVQHIQSYHYVSSRNPKVTAFTQQVSTVDYYLDSATLIPLSIVFNAHPDNDANTNIPVEVDYSNFQVVSGVIVPFHIVKTWGGTPLVDFTVTSLALNSGLPDSLFSIQQ